MINSDNSLLPLMSDPKEAAGLMIWAATYVCIDCHCYPNCQSPTLVLLPLESAWTTEQ